jgi:hypothetical protein
MEWLSKNLKWITIILFFLFCIKSCQSCNRQNLLNTQEKKLSKDTDSLKKEIGTRDFLIMDLKNELKVAGVKYDEAQKRADAIQKTASSIRANTTIQIKGAEKEPNETFKKK